MASCAEGSLPSRPALKSFARAECVTSCCTVDPRNFMSGLHHTTGTPGGGASCSTIYAHDVASLQAAIALLRDDQVVAIPTETVYGLAANALSAAAVARIFAAKQRPQDNPLIVHVSSLDMLHSLYPQGLRLPEVYREVVDRFWPGALTILLPRSPLVPDAVTCGQPTMAVRMPSHPVARALIELAGLPLAAPSANSSGRPSPTQAAHVLADLSGRIPLVLDGGACGCGVESTVLDGLRSPPAVLRPGGVTVEQLRQLPGLANLQVYKKDFTDAKLELAPTTPGMKYRHYSPDARVVLIELVGCGDAEESRQHQDATALLQRQTAAQLDRLRAEGARSIGILRTSLPDVAPGTVLPTDEAGAGSTVEYVLGSWQHPDQVAQQLFAGLRYLDSLGLDVIVVEGVLEEDTGLAVMNRLRKAASTVVTLNGSYLRSSQTDSAS